MSQMYGKKRVVLKNQPDRWGRYQVVICGSNEPSANYPGTGKKAGNYHPLGFWYNDGGLFYTDLQSAEALYGPKWEFNKRLAGVPTKAALREFIMGYYDKLCGTPQEGQP